MKKLFFPDKSFSWLQFPVALKGLMPEKHPHLTLKFFGSTEIDSYAIENRIGTNVHEALKTEEFGWTPKLWEAPADVHYVLAFTKYPPVLKLMHDMFDIVKDQYIPWTPHITVPKDYFLMVNDQGLTPADMGLQFGEVELCLGKPNL